MSDLQWLFLILALFYAWECACWIRRGSVALVQRFGKKWRLNFPGTLGGNQRGGFVLAQPLPPLGRIFVAQEFALSLSPEVAFAHLAVNASPSWRPLHSGQHARFADLREIVARGKTLVVNGRVWARFASLTNAKRYAEFLKQLVKRQPAERAKEIRKFIAEAFDEREISRRRREFESETRRLRWLCNGLVLFLFALAPAAIWRLGLQLSWLPLVIGLFSLSTWAAVIFHRRHRQWFPEEKDERFSHTLIVALAPASGARALDHLSRPLLESFHPLAVAKVFLAEEGFRAFARRVLLDLRHPALPLSPTNDPGAVGAEDFMRNELRQAAEGFLKRHSIEPEQVCKPPMPTEESCRAYCPRCDAQFTALDATCADCGGLAVVAFGTVGRG